MFEEASRVNQASEIGGLEYGPAGFTNIAIMGTAGTSVALAPFKDEKWAIWACSPGCFPICAQHRSDVWFEPHRWQPTAPGQFGAPGTKPWFSPEFHAFLKKHKGPVFMSAIDPTIPMSVRIPFEMLRDKYGPYFFSSTISYMIAMAIEVLAPRSQFEKVSIGMFGVDMAATEEWAYQRPACQHFLGLAMSLGINVVLPPESDLMRPTTMYGIGELNPRHIRILARKKESEALLAQATQQHNESAQRIHQLRGQIAEQDYLLNVWADDVEPNLLQAVSFSQEYQKPVGALTKAAQEAKQTTGAEVVPLAEKTA